MGARHPVLDGYAAYAVARSDGAGLTRSGALDYAGAGILAKEVLPGAVPSKVRFHPDNPHDLQQGQQLSRPGTDTERHLPLGYGKGEEIAAEVLYLVGPAGSHFTG